MTHVVLIVLHLFFVFVNYDYGCLFIAGFTCVCVCINSPCVWIVHSAFVTVEPLHTCYMCACACLCECLVVMVVTMCTDQLSDIVVVAGPFNLHRLVECCLLFLLCIVSSCIAAAAAGVCTFHAIHHRHRRPRRLHLLLHWLDWCCRLHSCCPRVCAVVLHFLLLFCAKLIKSFFKLLQLYCVELCRKPIYACAR